MTSRTASPRPLTGAKVLAIAVTFFVTVMSVNIYMASRAVSTFSGLEVRNSYIASQHFDRDRSAQLDLGWSVAAEVREGQLILAITAPDGEPAEVAAIGGVFGRATHLREDQYPDFTYDNGVFLAPVTTEPGNWNLRLDATAADGTRFRQRVVIRVKG